MERTRDSAMILRRSSFGEADVLLTLLTQQHGKIRVLAKGARKSSSRLVGHTELFSVINGQINIQPSIPILSQVVVEHSIHGLAEDGTALQRISLLAEIVDRALEEGIASESIYHVMVEGSLRLRQKYQPLLFIGLIVRLLGLLGYAPELSHCVACKSKISESETFGWSHNAGGIITNGCIKNSSVENERVRADTIKALRYLQRQPLAEMGRLQTTPEVIDELHPLMINYARYVLEHPIVSATISYTDELNPYEQSTSRLQS